METDAAPATPTPTRIHADRAAGTLELEWQDGHRTVYGAHALRWLCPCAFCRGEAGLPGWLDTSPTLTEEQTRLVDVHLVGNYAIAPTWGDGHHTRYPPPPPLSPPARRTPRTAPAPRARGARARGAGAGVPGDHLVRATPWRARRDRRNLTVHRRASGRR